MKINSDSDLVIFESTGKKVYANCGIIGVSSDSKKIYLSEGYDGDFPDEELSKEEREELADYMINLWTEFKNGK